MTHALSDICVRTKRDGIDPTTIDGDDDEAAMYHDSKHVKRADEKSLFGKMVWFGKSIVGDSEQNQYKNSRREKVS